MTPPTVEKLAEILNAVEERLQPEQIAIVIVATPQEDGSFAITFGGNCCDESAQRAFAHLARNFDEKTPIAKEAAH